MYEARPGHKPKPNNHRHTSKGISERQAETDHRLHPLLHRRARLPANCARDRGTRVGLKSSSTVHRHLCTLRDEGVLTMIPNKNRTTQIGNRGTMSEVALSRLKTQVSNLTETVADANKRIAELEAQAKQHRSMIGELFKTCDPGLTDPEIKEKL